jgi:putative intracellular protease/amidase
MFDLTDRIALIDRLDAPGKLIAAVCNGPAVLLEAKSVSGQPLIRLVEVAGLSNAEEEPAGLTSVMPFRLKSELARDLVNRALGEESRCASAFGLLVAAY